MSGLPGVFLGRGGKCAALWSVVAAVPAGEGGC